MNTSIKPRKQVKIYKDLDFKSLEEYYDYILESVYNEQKEQAIKLYKQLNQINRKEFYYFCKKLGSMKGYEIVTFS